jgi:hypothetical protein
MNDTQYTATEIQAMVRNMDDSKDRHRALKATNVELYVQKLTQENTVLHFNFPSIFSLHAEDKLDGTFFYMLDQKRKIERGDLTEDQASIDVGNITNEGLEYYAVYEDRLRRLFKFGSTINFGLSGTF